MKLQELTLRFLRVPLIQPYVLSYRTYTAFEPIIVEAHGADGRIGWGEGHISPGSSSETLEGGWAFCRKHAAAIIGKDTIDAKAIIAAHQKDSKVAATALLTAIEMLEGHPLLNVATEARLPMSPMSQPFRLCSTSRFAPLRISSVRRPFATSASAN